jgi:hypothetical protein
MKKTDQRHFSWGKWPRNGPFYFFKIHINPSPCPLPSGERGYYIVSSPKGERIEVRGDLLMKYI